MIAILDYKAGNQTSVARALGHLGIPCRVTADPSMLEEARGIIFPGVGAAGQAMDYLRKNGLDALLRQAIGRGKPLLGICLGCQILLEHSEEGDTPCLGIVPGRCRRFQPRMDKGLKIPHMGWNTLQARGKTQLLDGIWPDAEFYFVHSYYVEPQPDLVLATTAYGGEFCSVYGREGLWATQFHPEKSGKPGLRLLKNFYDWCSERANAF